jgi:bacterioferritin
MSSIGEMKHADEVIERLIFLEAIPNMTGYDKVSVGANVKQQLESDMASKWLP